MLNFKLVNLYIKYFKAVLLWKGGEWELADTGFEGLEIGCRGKYILYYSLTPWRYNPVWILTDLTTCPHFFLSFPSSIRVYSPMGLKSHPTLSFHRSGGRPSVFFQLEFLPVPIFNVLWSECLLKCPPPGVFEIYASYYVGVFV